MRVIAAVEQVLTGFGHAVLFACRVWVWTCVRMPLRLWAKFWTRKSLSLGMRLSVVGWPWLVFLVLVVAPTEFVDWEYDNYVVQRAEPTPVVYVADRIARPLWFARVRAWERWDQASARWVSAGPWGTVRLREAGLVASKLILYPFAISMTLGGVVWVAATIGFGLLHQHRGRAARGLTISGRPVRRVSPREFSKARALALKQGIWLFGRGATFGGRLDVVVGLPERVMHTLVVGATGTGKTQSVLLTQIRSDILAGIAVTFIDGKGDNATLDAIWAIVKEAGRESDLVVVDLRRPAASHTYSPLRNGSANEQADNIMAAFPWDNGFYRAQSRAVLLRVIRALVGTKTCYSLDDVLAAISSLGALRALAELTDEQSRNGLAEIAARWREYQNEIFGLRAHLESLLLSDFGELLKSPRPSLDLAEAYRSSKIVYFVLPTVRFKETAALVAKLIIGDLGTVAGMVQEGVIPLGFQSIVIDEFAGFAMPEFVNLLNKARSAGMAFTIAHQSVLGDFTSEDAVKRGLGPGFAAQIADNKNVKIVLRQTADAEHVAGWAGTYRTMKYTEQTQDAVFGLERSGLGSVHEEDEYHVSPNIIRELPQGYALFQVRAPVSYLELVRLDRYVGPTETYEPRPAVRLKGDGVELRRYVRHGASGDIDAGRTPRRRRAVDPEKFE